VTSLRGRHLPARSGPPITSGAGSSIQAGCACAQASACSASTGSHATERLSSNSRTLPAHRAESPPRPPTQPPARNRRSDVRSACASRYEHRSHSQETRPRNEPRQRLNTASPGDDYRGTGNRSPGADRQIGEMLANDYKGIDSRATAPWARRAGRATHTGAYSALASSARAGRPPPSRPRLAAVIARLGSRLEVVGAGGRSRPLPLRRYRSTG
jgi:hypothetical protein